MLSVLIYMKNPYLWLKSSLNSCIFFTPDSAHCFILNWLILQHVLKALTLDRTSMTCCSLWRDQISTPPKRTLTPICLPKSERIGKMLFSLSALELARDQREKNRTLPEGSPADKSVKSLQRKRRRFIAYCPSAPHGPGPQILEAPEVACGLWYNSTRWLSRNIPLKPRYPGWWLWLFWQVCRIIKTNSNMKSLDNSWRSRKQLPRGFSHTLNN